MCVHISSLLSGFLLKVGQFLSRSIETSFLVSKFWKTTKSPKPSLLQNHHFKINISTKLIVVKYTQNSLILIRETIFDEKGSIFDWILALNLINTFGKSRQRGNKKEREMRDEDRIKEFQVWRFKSLAQRFPQLWEKVASWGKKGKQPLL